MQKLEGEKLKAYVALLGWKSVDHHLSFRETAFFKKLIEGMDQPRPWKKMEAVHVRLRNIRDNVAGGIGYDTLLLLLSQGLLSKVCMLNCGEYIEKYT